MSALFSISPSSPASTPLSNAFAAIIAEAARKPRNRSEWEARFTYWQKPASDTEEQQTDATAKRIARAMRHSTFLPQRQWRIVKQGMADNPELSQQVRSHASATASFLIESLVYNCPEHEIGLRGRFDFGRENPGNRVAKLPDHDRFRRPLLELQAPCAELGLNTTGTLIQGALRALNDPDIDVSEAHRAFNKVSEV